MRLLKLIPILVAASPLVSADAPDRAVASQPTFRAESQLVVLHVSVRDHRGRYITGLTKDAFTVIDDGKPQAVEMFSADEVPATVGFLIDNSNSMRPSRERVIASSIAFARHSHPQDEIFVMTFNEHVRRAWGPAVVSEMSPTAFAAAVSSAITAQGMTAIYDGIVAGVDALQAARHTRQVLIAVSDGGDNASKATLEEAQRRIHDSDATVYAVALIDPLVRDGNPRLLRRLARSTGGEFYSPRSVDDVPEAFERIAKDIRSAYTLAYTPAKSATPAERRRRAVRVYVRGQDGRALSVRTRDGYFEKTDEDQR